MPIARPLRILAVLVPTLAIALAFGPVDDEPTAVAVQASPGTYAIDTSHSTVHFRIKHLGIANFYGRFNSLRGQYVLDLDAPEQCSVSLTIDPASADTNSPDRDTHIRSAEFLDVEQHDEIRFESTRVWAAGTNRLGLQGDLTLHGETRTVSAEAEVTGAGDTFFRDYRTGVEAQLTIKRSEFGMTHLMGPLGDEITLIVSLEGIQQ